MLAANYVRFNEADYIRRTCDAAAAYRENCDAKAFAHIFQRKSSMTQKHYYGNGVKCVSRDFLPRMGQRKAECGVIELVASHFPTEYFQHLLFAARCDA